ncbi:MAG TPA: AsmA-like C-terminal region-containing protein, partial [Rhodopila sp.]|uniref:AsmA-like C-terminal region-containing protein n=1 Tax=Rhodopila sp. TaxID=2480087 RepID=UPI002BC393A1
MGERLDRTWWHRARHHPVTRHSGFVLWHCSRAAHRMLLMAMGMLVVMCSLLAFGAWQLSQRPINGLWLANRLNAALTERAAPVRVAFGAVTLSWSGFSLGVDEPIDLHVSEISLVDTQNRKIATASDAKLGFSFSDLIFGKIFPRSVEVEHALLILSRDSAAMEPGGEEEQRSIPLDQLSASLNHRAGADAVAEVGRGADIPEIPSQLREVRFHDTDIVFRDAAAHLDLRGQHMDLDVVRLRNGHIRGRLTAPLTVGRETAKVRAAMDLVPGGDSTAEIRVAPFRPAAMAQSSQLAFLRVFDAPMSLDARAVLDHNWYPAHIQASARLGAGQIRLGAGAVPVQSGVAVISGSPASMTLSRLHLVFKQAADGIPEVADVDGTLTRTADRIAMTLNVAAGHIDAADLPMIWPTGIGGGARPWIAEHVTGGIANGTASFAVEGDERLQDVTVTQASGDLDVENAVFTWIDHMPPIDQGMVRLHLVDPDTLDILMTGGHQRVGPGKPDLIASDGRMRITGLMQHDQFADLRLGVKGPVTSALSLLSEPRLKLLSAHPIGLKPNAGDVSGTLAFQFPLEHKLQMDDVAIHADMRLNQVHLPDVVAKHALDGGVFDMSVGRDGLTLKGTGNIAAIPLTIDGSMDFRAGPPNQAVQTITASGEATVGALANAGLPVADTLSGSLAMTANLVERRDGTGTVRLSGDLGKATLTFAPLAFSRPLDRAASATAVLTLFHDQLTGVERFSVTGDGVSAAGSVSLPPGQAKLVTLDRLVLGRTDARGTVRIAADGAIAVALQGPVIDLSAKLTETGKPDEPPTSTPPWTLTGRFDRAVLAHDVLARDLSMAASGGGDKLGLMDVTGTIDSGTGFSLRLAPSADRRHLSVQAGDAGRFLLGLDAVKGLSKGQLSIEGDLPPGIGLSPLTGTMSIEDAVVRNSPVLGKLLQAITLYGLVDALRGPGMGFNRISSPFRYDGHDLYLDDAVAENSSLGLTAKGRIGLGKRGSALSGTIVPAYFFNALPGRIPLIGRLFSPEKGGGLFAARFDVDGPIGDPNVSINPVSAL